MPPFQDFFGEVIFVEMACKHVDWLLGRKGLGNYTCRISPVIEDENAAWGLNDKTAVKDIDESHFSNSLGTSLQRWSSLMILGAAFPASTNIFLPLR